MLPILVQTSMFGAGGAPVHYEFAASGGLSVGGSASASGGSIVATWRPCAAAATWRLDAGVPWPSRATRSRS